MPCSKTSIAPSRNLIDIFFAPRGIRKKNEIQRCVSILSVLSIAYNVRGREFVVASQGAIDRLLNTVPQDVMDDATGKTSDVTTDVS